MIISFKFIYILFYENIIHVFIMIKIQNLLANKVLNAKMKRELKLKLNWK